MPGHFASLLVPLMALAAACAPAPVPLDNPTDGGLEPHDDAGFPWPASCEAPVSKVEEALAPGRIVVLGEIHGTEQAPAFVAQLACEAALRRMQVTVGLEFPVAEQPALESFLQSAGDASARQALLAGEFWRRESFLDGRSSAAAVGMLEALRRLGPAVRVFAFDVGVPADGGSRDVAMAARIRQEREAVPGGLFIIHTGNIHAWVQPGAPWDDQFVPMAYELLGSHPNLLSLDMGHAGGTAWTCNGPTAADCGERKLVGFSPADAEGIELFDQPGQFHGLYHVGTITASPPAAL
jgi:hypothetical protein